jgi:hypothetical protein
MFVTVGRAAGRHNVTLMTQPLSAGSSTFTIPAPVVGTHTLQATYTTQGNLGASSASGSLIVNSAASQATITKATANIGGKAPNQTASWNVSGTGQAVTGNVVTVKLGVAVIAANVPVTAKGEWTFTPPEQYAAQRTVCFIHSPRPIQTAEIAPHALVQNRSIPRNPTSNRGMINAQTTFCHHLFQIAITERIPEIPPHTQHDQPILKMSSSERRRRFFRTPPTLLALRRRLRHYP